MSLPEGRLTRRQIVSGAAALPVLALAQKAFAQTPTPTPTSMSAVMGALVSPIPMDQLREILDDAEQRYLVDRNKYQLIAVTLWDYFALGVEREGQSTITIPPENGILTHAYGYTTGAKVAQYLLASKYPANGNHIETNVCAYRCGEHAAAAAKYHGSTMITTAIYEKAWDVTKQEMSSALAKARVAAELLNPGSNVPVLYQGMGC